MVPLQVLAASQRCTARSHCFQPALPVGAPALQAIGVPIARLALYTACGGIVPSACLPVTIDAGTDNEALLQVGGSGLLAWAFVEGPALPQHSTPLPQIKPTCACYSIQTYPHRRTPSMWEASTGGCGAMPTGS